MNLAALWQLPVLFCCENNLYAMGTALERSESETDLALKAASYEMPAWSVDGMDVLAVEARGPARGRSRPRRRWAAASSSCRTYRFRAHSMYDPELYRDKAEVEEWKQRDPIDALHRAARRPARLDRRATSPSSRREVAAEIDDAVAFAEAGHARSRSRT